jgi:hypothetical protein
VVFTFAKKTSAKEESVGDLHAVGAPALFAAVDVFANGHLTTTGLLTSGLALGAAMMIKAPRNNPVLNLAKMVFLRFVYGLFMMSREHGASNFPLWLQERAMAEKINGESQMRVAVAGPGNRRTAKKFEAMAREADLSLDVFLSRALKNAPPEVVEASLDRMFKDEFLSPMETIDKKVKWIIAHQIKGGARFIKEVFENYIDRKSHSIYMRLEMAQVLMTWGEEALVLPLIRSWAEGYRAEMVFDLISRQQDLASIGPFSRGLSKSSRNEVFW